MAESGVTAGWRQGSPSDWPLDGASISTKRVWSG